MSQAQRTFILVGLSLLLGAMLAPFFATLVVSPFVMVMVHVIGVVEGLLLFAIAWFWPFLSLGRNLKILALLTTLVALIFNWIGTLISSILGSGRSEFIVQRHYVPGYHGAWNVITLLFLNLSELILLSLPIFMYGFIASKRQTKLDTVFSSLAWVLFVCLLAFIIVQTCLPHFGQ